MLILELAEIGNLEDFLGEGKVSTSGPDYNFAQSVVSQLVSAVAHIHNRDIIHRNISPGNILLKKNPNDHDYSDQDDSDVSSHVSSYPCRHEYSIKLIGFDTAILSKSKQFLPPLEPTPFNQAPELMKSAQLGQVKSSSKTEGSNTSDFTEAVDIWSIGCLTYYLLTHQEPEFNNEGILLNPNHQAEKNFTDTQVDFMKICLQPRPNQRAPTFELETSNWVQSANYVPIIKQLNSQVKKEFFDILSQALGISAKSLSKRCHEQRFDELSAMYNLFRDNCEIEPPEEFSVPATGACSPVEGVVNETQVRCKSAIARIYWCGLGYQMRF